MLPSEIIHYGVIQLWKVWGMRTARKRKWNQTLLTFLKGQNDLWGQRITSRWDDTMIMQKREKRITSKWDDKMTNIALTERERENIPKKLFPKSFASTLEASTMVKLPMPPSTKFFKASAPVGPQLSRQILACSRANCPWSPQILQNRQFILI